MRLVTGVGNCPNVSIVPIIPAVRTVGPRAAAEKPKKPSLPERQIPPTPTFPWVKQRKCVIADACAPLLGRNDDKGPASSREDAAP